MVELTERQRLAGRGVALCVVGAMFTITIVGAFVGIPMFLLGVVFLVKTLFAGGDDAENS
ncbi:uncharacterized protein Nmlp_3666 [Natronomonas moolapensis 8.8.11]|uniref:Uncharacterized protein n=1 Tax=Natronomonas moolapensis (strain DSM 18674 / CECT 7526 / JCM 14361 / 8.8.11) TaxID=268739 RepID=M1XLI5_NATM8|nr:hypothetical protein [Natronomonas moolapensis]CCQ37781.1 uncharacterized protein Nmlp_3666 [Natronomonas moolapensis 8.8.11]